MWLICFILSIVIFCIGLIYPRLTKRRETRLQTFQIFFACVIVAIFIYMLPIYRGEFIGQAGNFIHTLCLALYNTLALFVICGDYSGIIDVVSELPRGLSRAYQLWTSVLFVVAPLMTFGFVIRIFSSLREMLHFGRGYFKNSYIFSELNEKSYLLAKDLVKQEKNVQIVFADVSSDVGETELGREAKNLDAVLLRREVTDVQLSGRSKNTKVTFLLIGEDETEHVLTLTQKYGNRPNTNLIFVADDTESEFLLSAIDTSKMQMVVRRKSEAQSLVYRHLYEKGYRLFESAREEAGHEKMIRAAVVGMSSLGQEMVRALSWYGQMIGYEIRIDAIGSAEDLQTLRFAAPEMLDPKINGKKIEGESQCNIVLHAVDDTGVDALNICRELNPTYLIIDLEDDAKNIETAVALRTMLLRDNLQPVIDTLIRDAGKNSLLQNLADRRQESYNITIIGSDADFYSKDTLLSSELDQEALARHMQYCMNADTEEKERQEKAFWRYEYNYRSSMASAIHKKARIECKIPGADKDVQDRSEEEKIALRILEHKRWNAYMRSQGYCYGLVRNDLAKLHHCLVPFDQLPLSEQIKDDD